MGKFWISFGFTLVASIILVLTCEAPTIAIEKIIFPQRRRPEKEIKKLPEKTEAGQV